MEDKLLDSCPAAIRQRLLARSFDPGELLLLQGEQERWLYLLRQGQVEIFKQLADGRQFSVGLMQPGVLIGDLEALGQQSVLHTARAVTACETLCLTREDFFDWCRSSWPFCRQVMDQLAQKVVLLSQQAALNSCATLDQILLLELAQAAQRGQSQLDKAHVVWQMAAAPRSTNRVLARFRQQGFIDVDRTAITILDRAALFAQARRAGLSCQNGHWRFIQ